MGPNRGRTSVTRWSLFGHSRPLISSDKPPIMSIDSNHRQHTTQAVIKGQLAFWRGKQWCPGADSNHRHADFQSAALPTELPGHWQAYITCEAATKTAAGNGIAAHPLPVQREKQRRSVTGRVRYHPRNAPSPRQAIRRLCRRPIPPPE